MIQTKPPPSTTAQAQDALAKLNLASGHCAVVGLQWGDEGKGQIVDMLAQRYDCVVRYNGGNNAGHSVQIGDDKFALHLIPSGILYPNAVNVVGNGVVVDPAGMLGEIKGLRERGVSVGPNLRVSDKAHVVFPYHKKYDLLLDQAIGKSSGDGARIGTTGRGIGPCYADKALRSLAVRMGELLRPEQLRVKLRHIVAIKNLVLAALAGACGEAFTPYDADALCDEYLAYGQALSPHICDTTQLLLDSIDAGKRLLFEGANATLLDIDHGTYPYVTSSSCSSLGIYTGAGVPGGTLKGMIGVVKAYTSRVGGGPHPTELLDPDPTGKRIREVGREFGTTTGRPRRIGWLDLAAVRYTARLSGATAIASTGLSILSGLGELKVCVGYQIDGKRVDFFPADSEALAAAQPIYQEVEGWAEPLGDCRGFGDLPKAARDYVEMLEKFVGVPVRLVCVGRRRDQILVRG